MAVRVVGLGQPFAGDDGVGHVVLDALSAEAVAGIEILRAREASEFVTLMSRPAPIIVVDAVVGAGDAGTVHVLGEAALDASAMNAASSHGIGVAQAVAMGRVLYSVAASGADAALPVVYFVAIAIDEPRRAREGLSPAVARAVAEAVRRVEELVGELR